jgi:hypothetical protein
MATSSTKWSLEADYLQACNCDYGCPCEFEAPPTMGFCEGMGIYRINRGSLGNVSLDGVSFAFGIKFPGAMHKGNGTAIWVIDSRATPEQRDAMNQILSGKLGGMPFEVFPMLISNLLPAQYAPIDFTLDGRNSRATIGGGSGGEIAVEPIKNPVTGDAEQIRVEHGTGFIFKAADCVSAKEGRLNLGGFSISYPNKAGFVAKVMYSN